jgi:hypothetical protein
LGRPPNVSSKVISSSMAHPSAPGQDTAVRHMLPDVRCRANSLVR